AMLFVARPLSIWLSTIGTDLTNQEKTLIGWIAPRGIVALTVSGYFASTLLEAGFEDAELLTALTFALVFSTVVAHGFSIGWLGKKLGLASSDEPGILIVGSSRFNIRLAEILRTLNKNVLIMDPAWGSLQLARQLGIPNFVGEILSEHTEYELDLTPYETMIVATDTDSYNSLVVNNFVPELGRVNLYQTAIHIGNPADFHSSLSGRTLFGSEWNIHALEAKIDEGYAMRKTQLTEQYNYADFQEKSVEGTIPLFIERAQGKIEFFTDENKMEAKIGDTIVSFSPPAHQENRIQGKLETNRLKSETQSKE